MILPKTNITGPVRAGVFFCPEVIAGIKRAFLLRVL